MGVAIMIRVRVGQSLCKRYEMSVDQMFSHNLLYEMKFSMYKIGDILSKAVSLSCQHQLQC